MRQLHTFGSVGGEARQRPLLPGHGRRILVPPQGSSWLLASSPPAPRFNSPTLCRPNIEFAWAAHDQGGVTIYIGMNGKRISAELIGILAVGATLLGVILASVIGLGMMIQSGQRDTADRFAALESRLRTVEQVQAQHGLLLQLLAQRVLGADADLPQPAQQATSKAPEGSRPDQS